MILGIDTRDWKYRACGQEYQRSLRQAWSGDNWTIRRLLDMYEMGIGWSLTPELLLALRGAYPRGYEYMDHEETTKDRKCECGFQSVSGFSYLYSFF